MPAGDLEHILAHTGEVWQQLRGSRLFITGATGFYGRWLLESIVAANDLLGADVRASLLSRSPERFASELPRLALRPEFAWLRGEPDGFVYPTGQFDCVIHLATPSAAKLAAGNTTLALSVVQGMHRVLQFARQAGARRLLLASSGAVYGRQLPDLSQLTEDYDGAPDLRQPMSAYGEIKRMCELMCALTPAIDCVIARGFAFVGPYLPISEKFAIGSFLRDALAGGPIRIRGDGTALRSYLYAADMAIWLFTLLLRGRPGEAYNVGSDEAISLADLARAIAAAAGGVAVHIAQEIPVGGPMRYLPAIDKARNELGLEVTTPLHTSLGKTLSWLAPPFGISDGKIAT